MPDEETEVEAPEAPATLAERRDAAVPLPGVPEANYLTEEQAAKDRLGWAPEDVAADQAEEADGGDDEE